MVVCFSWDALSELSETLARYFCVWVSNHIDILGKGYAGLLQSNIILIFFLIVR